MIRNGAPKKTPTLAGEPVTVEHTNEIVDRDKLVTVRIGDRAVLMLCIERGLIRTKPYSDVLPLDETGRVRLSK